MDSYKDSTKGKKVRVPKGEPALQIDYSHNNSTNFASSMLGCASASGVAVPPGWVFKSKFEEDTVPPAEKKFYVDVDPDFTPFMIVDPESASMTQVQLCDSDHALFAFDKFCCLTFCFAGTFREMG